MACAGFLTLTLIGACTDPDDPPAQARADSAEHNRPAVEAAPQQTTRVTVGITGLILMVPASEPMGAAKLFMPNVQGHVAYVGFSKADSTNCDGYNPHLKICFMSLERSALAPIGPDVSTTQSTAPARVLNVTHHSGNTRADTTAIKGRAPRARATLVSGGATSSCAVGRWTIKPHAQTSAQTIEPANVVTWEIPAAPGGHVVLARTPLSQGAPSARSFTVPAQQGRVELLVVHIPEKEFTELENAKPGTGSTNPGKVNMGEIRSHLRAMYNLLGTNQHAFPDTVVPLTACTLNVLGLQNAAWEVFNPVTKKLGPEKTTGVRTLSCVMGVADEG
jgi:hypothetical protein